MYKVGDKLVYKKDVCVVKELRKNYRANKNYYILTPIDDSSLTIEIPTDNEYGYLRDIISKEESMKLLDKIPSIEPLDITDKRVDNDYKLLLQSDNLENLIKVIKTTYLRNKERELNNRKPGEKDNSFFLKAEKKLYNELSVSLNMSYDEVKKYVIDYVNKNNPV